MSSHHNEQIACPNCGFEATKNYCAQCGQQTAIHKDTLWNLILHFLEHYLHYDNKFWQTLKALLFSPGKLTVAYWNRQRARYISPVSLYIFITAVYFGFAYLVMPLQEKATIKSLKETAAANSESAKTQILSPPKTDMDIVAQKVAAKPEQMMTELIEKVQHITPKLFFFMIPFAAWIVYLLFLKRKDMYYVDHAIFILHFHCFYFMVALVTSVLQALILLLNATAVAVATFGGMISLAAFIVYIVYFVAAMTNAYKISTGRALGYAFIVGLIYFIIFGSIIVYYAYWLLRYEL